MIDGIYDIVSETPLGEKRGALELETDGDRVIARVEMMGMKQCSEGTVDGDSFALSGETRVMLRSFSYRLDGSVAGDTLAATMHALDKSFSVRGTRR